MKYLTMDEQKLLVKTVKEVKGAERDHVIIETLLNTGLRARELVSLTVGDVRNKHRLYIQPAVAKKGSGGFIPLNVKLQDVLRTWIKRKLSVLHESNEDAAPLFVTRLGDPLTKRSLQNVVERWVVKAGLTTMKQSRAVALYSTHSLRHTFAKRMQERGVPLTTIQKILRHSSLASTGVYTEASDVEMDEAANLIGARRGGKMKWMDADKTAMQRWLNADGQIRDCKPKQDEDVRDALAVMPLMVIVGILFLLVYLIMPHLPEVAQ